MADAWIEFGLSNSCIAGALALLAYSVHRRANHPLLAHALWLCVLLKLITPPLLNVPLLPYPASVAAIDPALPELHFADLTATRSDIDLGTLPAAAPDLSVRRLVGWAWLIGSALVLIGSLLRTIRFQLSMVSGTRIAGAPLRALAEEVARGHGLRRCPEVRVMTARVTPFVWQFWGRPRIVLPEALATSMPPRDLQLVLAHELAHVRRKDHWVRWVEWLAAVAFWWNPITWWSQRNLRASEELACDALVLTTFQPERQRYASSLLGVTEFLSTEGVRPPRVATPMSRGGELETRITMIITDRLPRTPRWVVSAALALGAAFLPLSVAYAQDYAAIERRLAAAVEAGEITKAQAEAMMGALARTAAEKSKPAEADMRAKRMRYAEFEKGIKARVEKGAMSPEEAEARLRETREKMFGGEAAGKRDVDPRAMRERYAQLEKRIAAAVESGRITREQGAERLAQARERMMGATRAKDAGEGQAEARAMRERYAQLEERIAAAVESGRMTREQGAERLAQAKERMMEATRAKGAGEGQADMRARRMRYAEYEKGIKARVEKGAMSPEEAEAKLRATREKMFGGDKTRKAGPEAGKKGASREKKADDSARGKKVDETSMKALYAEYEKRLDVAVAKGEMTAEQAKAKLADAREKMFGGDKARKTGPKAGKKGASREKKPNDSARGKGVDEGSMKARYAEYEKRLDDAVAKGEMTAEQAKAKLAEARRKMFGE